MLEKQYIFHWTRKKLEDIEPSALFFAPSSEAEDDFFCGTETINLCETET